MIVSLKHRVPELIFWHIPSKAYEKVAPWFGIRKPCVGSINKEKVASQEAETGIMGYLKKRSSVKVGKSLLVDNLFSWTNNMTMDLYRAKFTSFVACAICFSIQQSLCTLHTSLTD